MKHAWFKWWRFALHPSRKGVVGARDGVWVHVIGPIWWRHSSKVVVK